LTPSSLRARTKISAPRSFGFDLATPVPACDFGETSGSY
jgi:hypothetical protein